MRTVLMRTETVNAADFAKLFDGIAAEVNAACLRGMKTTIEKIKTEMDKPGKPITYPVQWDSEKQRRAFFSTNGFGRGIPTKRTGAYLAARSITAVENGYLMRNTAPYAMFVSGGSYGNTQSRIHRGRWNKLNDAIDAGLAGMKADILSELKA